MNVEGTIDSLRPDLFSKYERFSVENPDTKEKALNFYGFKYIVKSCPGLERKDDELKSLFAQVSGVDNDRSGYLSFEAFEAALRHLAVSVYPNEDENIAFVRLVVTNVVPQRLGDDNISQLLQLLPNSPQSGNDNDGFDAPSTPRRDNLHNAQILTNQLSATKVKDSIAPTGHELDKSTKRSTSPSATLARSKSPVSSSHNSSSSSSPSKSLRSPASPTLSELLHSLRLEAFHAPLLDFGVQTVQDILELTEEDFVNMGFKELQKRRLKDAVAYVNSSPNRSFSPTRSIKSSPSSSNRALSPPHPEIKVAPADQGYPYSLHGLQSPVKNSAIMRAIGVTTDAPVQESPVAAAKPPVSMHVASNRLPVGSGSRTLAEIIPPTPARSAPEPLSGSPSSFPAVSTVSPKSADHVDDSTSKMDLNDENVVSPSKKSPYEWEEFFTPEGLAYYHNPHTNETVWERPETTSLRTAAQRENDKRQLAQALEARMRETLRAMGVDTADSTAVNTFLNSNTHRTSGSKSSARAVVNVPEQNVPRTHAEVAQMREAKRRSQSSALTLQSPEAADSLSQSGIQSGLSARSDMLNATGYSFSSNSALHSSGMGLARARSAGRIKGAHAAGAADLGLTNTLTNNYKYRPSHSARVVNHFSGSRLANGDGSGLSTMRSTVDNNFLIDSEQAYGSEHPGSSHYDGETPRLLEEAPPAVNSSTSRAVILARAANPPPALETSFGSGSSTGGYNGNGELALTRSVSSSASTYLQGQNSAHASALVSARSRANSIRSSSTTRGELIANAPEAYADVFETLPLMDDLSKRILVRSGSVSTRRRMGYADPRPDVRPLGLLMGSSTPDGGLKSELSAGRVSLAVGGSSTVGQGPAGRAVAGFAASLREGLYGGQAAQKGARIAADRHGAAHSGSVIVNGERTQPSDTTSGYAYRHAAAASRWGGQGNVIERLTDHRGYTGVHRQRFDESGHGLGLAGRNSGAEVYRWAVASIPNTQSEGAPYLTDHVVTGFGYQQNSGKI